MHSEQADLSSLRPILSKQHTDILEDFRVELRRIRKRMRASDGGEILIAKFELNCAGVEVGFAKAASDHLRQTHQRRLQPRWIGSVFVIGVLVADGLCVPILSNL